MMIAFLYAMVAELINLSAIVGSFIAGVSLGSVVLRQYKSALGRCRISAYNFCIYIFCFIGEYWLISRL